MSEKSKKDATFYLERAWVGWNAENTQLHDSGPLTYCWGLTQMSARRRFRRKFARNKARVEGRKYIR